MYDAALVITVYHLVNKASDPNTTAMHYHRSRYRAEFGYLRFGLSGIRQERRRQAAGHGSMSGEIQRDPRLTFTSGVSSSCLCRLTIRISREIRPLNKKQKTTNSLSPCKSPNRGSQDLSLRPTLFGVDQMLVLWSGRVFTSVDLVWIKCESPNVQINLVGVKALNQVHVSFFLTRSDFSNHNLDRLMLL